jgi:hemerythrin
MMLPTWKDTYSVNHTKLDSQHKELFRLAAKVYNLDSSAATKVKIKELLLQFYAYMKEHFSEEEGYMQDIGYPDLDKHKAQHAQIIHSLNKTIKEAQNLKQIRQSMRIMVRKWLVEHIIKHDLEYEKWRKSNRIQKIKEKSAAEDEFSEL